MVQFMYVREWVKLLTSIVLALAITTAATTKMMTNLAFIFVLFALIQVQQNLQQLNFQVDFLWLLCLLGGYCWCCHRLCSDHAFNSSRVGPSFLAHIIILCYESLKKRRQWWFNKWESYFSDLPALLRYCGLPTPQEFLTQLRKKAQLLSKKRKRPTFIGIA